MSQAAPGLDADQICASVETAIENMTAPSMDEACVTMTSAWRQAIEYSGVRAVPECGNTMVEASTQPRVPRTPVP
jgi:hypothetical protein